MANSDLLFQLGGHSQTRVGSFIGGLDNSSSGTRTGFALNAFYVHGSSGNAWGMPFFATRASAIHAIYVHLDATTGTRANIVLQGDIYNEHGSSGTQPGSTLRDTTTTVTYPSSDDEWIKFDFSASPYTPSIGEILWFLATNEAMVPGTDYPSILNGWAGANSQSYMGGALAGRTTTVGFSSTGTVFTKRAFIVEYADGTVEGYPWTLANSGPFSGTVERGIWVPPNPRQLVIAAIGSQSSVSSTINGWKIYADGVAPGGSVLGSGNFGSDTNQSRDEALGYKVLSSPVTIPVNTAFRFVYTMGSSWSGPRTFTIQGYSAYAAVFDALVDRGLLAFRTEDDGAGGWTDTKSHIPDLSLFAHDWPGSSGGGRAVMV